MPWPEVSLMGLRAEFVALAAQPGVKIAALCRRFGISRKTAYKWLARQRANAAEDFADRSRRPRTSPHRSDATVERQVLALRAAHPCWGGRKIARRLHDLGAGAVPAPSTITAILRRHGQLEPAESAKHRAFTRFERDRPNELWQMDFKGDFALLQGRCHPLTVLDDCSRFALCVAACADEQATTVQERLTAVFRRYGLPEAMLQDNGSPWGDSPAHPHTVLTVWLMRLGIRVVHSRPAHPQTLGKDERFHRTLKAEVLQACSFPDCAAAQLAFDRWRDVYNLERPHAALGLAVPASRYQPSPRPFPEVLPPLEYAPGHPVRKVQQGGWISLRGHAVRLSKAFRGQLVVLHPTTTDGLWDVVFVTQRIAQIDLRKPPGLSQPVTHVPEHVLPMSPV
jgi:transposase InsO family protein